MHYMVMALVHSSNVLYFYSKSLGYYSKRFQLISPHVAAFLSSLLDTTKLIASGLRVMIITLFCFSHYKIGLSK